MTQGMPSPSAPLKIATRGSPLALAQAREAAAALAAAHGLPDGAFEIVAISTSGDRIVDRPLGEVGGKGLFTREIDAALLSERVDLAVHSMKDVAVERPPGLILDCQLARADPRDAFLSPSHAALAELPSGATVGTSSLRRRAQALTLRPDLEVVEFRGNVETRLRKLEDGVAHCTFLAVAGLERLGLDLDFAPVDPGEMLPAVAQGAIGIERRDGDARAADLLGAIHHAETGIRVAAERALLAGLDGSCETPIAGLAEIDGGEIRLRGEILRPDGAERHADDRRAPVADAARLGREMAADLLARAGEGFFDWRG